MSVVVWLLFAEFSGATFTKIAIPKLREFILVLFGKFLEGSLRSGSHSGIKPEQRRSEHFKLRVLLATMLGEWRPRFRQQPFHARARQRETAELFTVFFTV
jgi:hypothetical protein